MSASDPSLLLLGAALVSATPILYAALGELLIERAGVLNLGIEGTMLVGAVAAFMVAHGTGSGLAGMGCAVLAAAAFGGLFAALVVGLRLNQVVTGLAMTILGSGLSAFLGQSYVGLTLGEAGAASAAASGVYVAAALACAVIAALFLRHTRPGLLLRTLGENPAALDALGLPVVPLRGLYVVLGSGLIGLGGAFISVVLTPSWIENMTAGRGWIALALVIFARWRPLWIVAGAILFGLIDAYRFRAQVGGASWIDPHFLNMLPYVATLVVLGLQSRRPAQGAGTPTLLGVAYDRERR
ncbi:ABC transporter permease [Methylobacterium symbioticum]|uniref:Branched-chain amino acid transport system / permease component n=1 Tax=Methylobacterium symbioticum TaxID=2584084 RepID=A0A509E6S8_9HYPH|nr:ABC transporter permease [Methylobacterium symbioticum]VUD69812.1 hypothetical protein MET9862_00371 [Methylobacterium symbioticum]